MKMKKLTRVVFACIALAVISIGVTGCGTTAATKMAQANQVLITSANDGASEMVTFINAGKATRKQIDTFHAAYDAYYAAQMALKAVNLKLSVAEADPTLPPPSQEDIASARVAVSDAEALLLNLLNDYLRLN